MCAAVALLVVAASVPATDALFTAGFAGEVSAGGAVDVAQFGEPDGDGDPAVVQHPEIDDASELTSNGLPVRVLEEDPAGWPQRPTATVAMPVVNLSEGPAALRLVVRAAEDEAEATGGADPAALLVGATIGGDAIGDAPIRGSWFADHPEGLDLGTALGAGEQAVVSVGLWLASDAPAASFGRPLGLVLQVIGETVAGDQPILLEGVWE